MNQGVQPNWAATAWSFARPVVKPILPFIYRTWPATKNLKRYWDTFGRFPNVLAPKSFNERMQKKILFDRNPLLRNFADKLLAREYVQTKLGGDDHLTKLYAEVSSASEIPRLDLPSRYVMKPNHLSGEIKVVWDSSKILAGELEKLATGWLKRNYYNETQEWAYKKIEPKVFFEELLEVDGQVAPDYKFYCFDGTPRIVHVTRDRFEKPKLNVYDMNFRLLPVGLYGYPHFEGGQKPPNFDKMIDITSRLSTGVKFVRVDLYDVGGRTVCGELTSYVSNGRTRFVPPKWDRVLGSYWSKA